MASRASAKSRTAAPAGLTRDHVVAAALDLIDAHGLEAFSMRSLARELGVYPTALYWHAGSREVLLSDVVGLALRGIVPPDDTPQWDEWIREFGRRFRALLQAHPHLAPIVGSQLVSNAAAGFAVVERLLAKLHEAGFRDDGLVDAYNVVVGCAVGFVSLELAIPPTVDEVWADALQEQIAGISEVDFPSLSRNVERLKNRAFGLRWRGGADAPLDDGFDAMQDVVMRGLRARLSDL